MSTLSTLAGNVEHFRGRVLQDALDQATASYWRRRAHRLRWARPELDDYAGQASTQQLRAKWRQLEAQAVACEQRASVAELGGEEW